MSGHAQASFIKKLTQGTKHAENPSTKRRLCTDLTLLVQRQHAAQKLFLIRSIFKLSSVVCPVVCAGGGCLMALLMTTSCSVQQALHLATIAK